MNWTAWTSFPTPGKIRKIEAPKGPGVYELKNIINNKYVLVGISVGVQKRMKSLMPPPHGVGTRNNMMKREYVLENHKDIVYRTISTTDRLKAENIEKSLLCSGKYIFNT